MGAGASLNSPEQVDKATAKALAGNAWTDEHEKAFDDAAADGMRLMKARMHASRKASEAASTRHDVKRLAALLAGLEVEV